MGESEATGATDTGSEGSDGAGTSDIPSSADAAPAPDVPAKVAGIDYALPAEDAMHILADPAAETERLSNGGVSDSVLNGYDPLAGREPADFRSEFGTTDQNGNLVWDWQNQAPNNGFAGDPVESDTSQAAINLTVSVSTAVDSRGERASIQELLEPPGFLEPL